MELPVMQKNTSPDTQEAQTTTVPSSKESRGSFIGYMVVALGLALFIRFFIAAPFVVSGASMKPTFDDLHYLIVDRVSYNLENPARGDVVVFDLPQEGGRSLIKRIIGLPGETVVLRGDSVSITNDEHPQGFTLEEPYLNPENLGGATGMSVTLKDDEFFVLGDNRRVSADSRIWGVLPREEIVGRALVRLYPFSKISVLPGEARYEEK